MNEHLSSIWPCCFTAHVPCEEVLHSLQSGLGGAGYRALTRLDHHRSKHYARVGTVYTKSLYPRGSLELWLGRGRFLNPYLRGLILDLLRSEIKPKEKPGELFASEGVNLSGLEWSILCVWVRDWLRYCQRYYCTALSPDANIEQFFDAPVVMNYWKIKRKDPWPFKRRYIGSNQDMLHVGLVREGLHISLSKGRQVPWHGYRRDRLLSSSQNMLQEHFGINKPLTEAMSFHEEPRMLAGFQRELKTLVAPCCKERDFPGSGLGTALCTTRCGLTILALLGGSARFPQPWPSFSSLVLESETALLDDHVKPCLRRAPKIPKAIYEPYPNIHL
ncbi:UNVERIFIED_CONTAM: hypothetical protein Sindi_2922100 [Sesamum indicum]